MYTHENNSSSNFFTEETSPGSGQHYLRIKDVAKFYRGLTFGFYLDIPDDFPEHLVDVIKPHLTYEDFDYGKEFSVKAAMGAAAWMVLPFADKAFLSQCRLVKAGTAHIQLLHLEARSAALKAGSNCVWGICSWGQRYSSSEEES